MSRNPFQNFVVRYSAGEPVFQEGDTGATMYIVQTGRVRLFREINGRQHDLGEMEKGDFFGEMSILEGLPRTLSAEVVEDAELIEINSMTFDKMIRSNIEIAIRMLRKLSIRLRELEGRLGEKAGETAAPVVPPVLTEPERRADDEEPGVARLELVENGLVVPLYGADVLIGRYDPVTGQKPDVDLTEIDLKRSVSRRHARILQKDDGYVLLEEVGALNGTFVNGTKLNAGQSHPIADGDQLGVGMVKLVFRA
jgi:CRP-like cAMP-binding protein